MISGLLLGYYARACLCLFDTIVDLHVMNHNDFFIGKRGMTSFSINIYLIHDIWV